MDFNVKGKAEKFREESFYEQPSTREQEIWMTPKQSDALQT